MTHNQLQRLLPDAPLALCRILDEKNGIVEPPIRSEIFGSERFLLHAHSLAETHRATLVPNNSTSFFPRLNENILVLRQAHRYIGEQASTGYDISPAAEWLLDNFHLVEAQLKEIKEGLPGSYFRGLPVLIDEPLAGLPRVYGIAWAFVAHSDGAFDEESLCSFLIGYQEKRDLSLSEIWALPTTLRVVLVENLRRLALRIATNKAAREVANLCCDHIETYSLSELDSILALLNLRSAGNMFLVQMAQRLRDNHNQHSNSYIDWIRSHLPDLTAAQTQLPADQAADNLSMRNAITALRSIGDADWTDIVARSSELMRLMLTSSVFLAEDTATRDENLHEIEKLAKRSNLTELSVARILHEKIQTSNDDQSILGTSSYWLNGIGRPDLMRRLGLQDRISDTWRESLNRFALPFYLMALSLCSLAITSWILFRYSSEQNVVVSFTWLTILAAVAIFFPASEAVLAVLNRLIGESIKPAHLPRLSFIDGLPPEHRVMVVIPAMLTNSDTIKNLIRRLQLHYLANSEQAAQFALLTDWVDADALSIGSDNELLNMAVIEINRLNTLYPPATENKPRFLILHRNRVFNETEKSWIGWERKRGKLEQLIAVLASNKNSYFLDLGAASQIATNVKYVVTLDSDTQLPPGRLKDLVGVAAHPLNKPKLDLASRRVVSGYGILQPRISTPLPTPRQFTLYHWLFSGQCGVDPYSAATSEVYQDLFGEGTFTGKGLLNVDAMHAVLSARLPENRVLSHDLLEGSFVRCAAVTNIAVIEEAPFHADVAASRVHRWTRGDWQLLPFLLQPRYYPLHAINRWKLFDNLRRSLVAPMSFLALLLAFTVNVLSPRDVLYVVFAAFAAGPMIGAIAGFSPSRDDVAKWYFYRRAFVDLLRAFFGGLWHLVQLMQQARMSLDAILRTLYRLTISKRHLLQWTTAAVAQASAKVNLYDLARQHWLEPILALVLMMLVTMFGTQYVSLTIAVCTLWAASPVWTWLLSRTHPRFSNIQLETNDRVYLEEVARDTWRLFERCVGSEDNHLPPDNLQITPHDMVAHRTSPTNIGLYMLSVVCARQFGWIGTTELLLRLNNSLESVAKLERHHGHLLNWYDTQSLTALFPKYISTVDSGNLSGHLLAVSEACRELARAPYDCIATQNAIKTFRNKLDLKWKIWSDEIPTLAGDSSLAQLLSLADPIMHYRLQDEDFDAMLHHASADLEALEFSDTQEVHLGSLVTPALRMEIIWQLADYVATLRSAWLDIQASKISKSSGQHEAVQLLKAMSLDLERIAWQPDFKFLYHNKRRLLHIGYRIAEQQLDNSFYDLLASESRLTSLLAIAKGDVPVKHWAALGRPFYAVAAFAGLRSWSGSMFEYLMPSLVLDEPQGSVMHSACCAALKEQIAFTKNSGTPWGISESAYAARDNTLAYQYAPQGVPRLALRRTPPDEHVVAPYSTLLATQIAPHLAVINLKRLQALFARLRYGFIEALDYTPARQASSETFTPVVTFMAHHQGMSIVAVANVLLEYGPRNWSMSNAHIEAVSSLLHERVPREVLNLRLQHEDNTSQALKIRTPGLLREVVPGVSAIEPTHVLSNGRYTVTLRANGAGTSSLGQTGINRCRDDVLRDAYGSFFYVSWDRQPNPVSITQHPEPDPAADYNSTFHSDRICFDSHWPELQVHTTVWVSPEDDIEFRRVELRNMAGRTVDFELQSAFDITLATAQADEAHPAFGNLFIKAQWLATQEALVFERKPRLATESAAYAAHFIAVSDSQLVSLDYQIDRQRWLGRNNSTSNPISSFHALTKDSISTGQDDRGIENNPLDTGLDPVCALIACLRIPPYGKARLTFATTAHHDKGVLQAIIDKYRQHSHVQRSSLMSATLASIRLRTLGLSAEKFDAIQLLTTAIVKSLSRPSGQYEFSNNTSSEVCEKRLLWRFGISADRPIILVSASVIQGMGLLRSLVQALHIWAWGGIGCDVVVINAELASYDMPLQRELIVLVERYNADSGNNIANTKTCLHVMRENELSAEELSTLKILARVKFHADGRPFTHHVQEWIELHEESLEQRHLTSTSVVPLALSTNEATVASLGKFQGGGNEFKFDVSSKVRPKKPWSNVMANPDFGALLTETGGGYTWAQNSRLNQLTAWSNDPVADFPAEWFLLQDTKNQEIWSVAPSAWCDQTADYSVVHGQGYSEISHRRGDLETTVMWCVDPHKAVKQVHFRISNLGAKTAKLRVVGIAEWMMGANRSDRSTTYTSLFRQRLPNHKQTYSAFNKTTTSRLTALLCTQRQSAAGFSGGTAFLATVSDADDPDDWTCDRRECFDASGRLVLPDHFGQKSGDGLDPCAALAVHIEIKPNETAEQVFLIGYAHSVSAAQQLATLATSQSASQRMDNVRHHWDVLLGATQVKTPDPLFDALVNRWLIYQTVSCRLWARAGFYQAGGAYGYRDQLQDAMALTWTAPELLRKQIVLNASRQFPEGDVQHWWHGPFGAGVRTHFSDDLLWLPYACVRYLRTTDDHTLLDQSVPFIEGVAIPEGSEDAYYTPTVSAQVACVYEHAARAIDKSLKVGVHGLPLMGSGDWNDGMNRIGNEGRGESVWLAWFLYQLVADFSPLALSRGDVKRVQRWEKAANGWKTALQNDAWDGQWFKRAFFDDGSALGSHVNSEGSIDLIAQAWSVLSGAAQPALQRIALEAIEKNLIDHENGLIKLLNPPLTNQIPSAGYIQAYPPGIRENGGQYSHGAVWALMAQAAYATSLTEPGEQMNLPYLYFTYLSPAHRASNPIYGDVYGVEPYVMAGDVYTQPPYVGRGGWSWYTGAAAWMHRAAIESIFGLQITAKNLKFTPCLPTHWPQAELVLTRGDRTMRFIFYRSNQTLALEATLAYNPQLLLINQYLNWPELKINSCFVIPLLNG